MKSIIGYYTPPLTQEERDTCLAYTLPVLDKIYTQTVVYSIQKLIDKVMMEAEGDLLQPGLVEQMTDKITNELREYTKRHLQLPIMEKFSVTFERSGANSVITVMSQELKDVIDGKIILTDPRSAESRAAKDDDYICKRYNSYLIANPDKRVFDQTPLALEINKANDQILKRLQDHGYETQTSNPLYDFSDIILGIRNF